MGQNCGVFDPLWEDVNSALISCSHVVSHQAPPGVSRWWWQPGLRTRVFLSGFHSSVFVIVSRLP